jgi:polyisoprenoid-binding protein YceI
VTAQLRGLPTRAGAWTVSDSRTTVTFSVANLWSVARGSVSVNWGEVVVGAAGEPVRVRAELDLHSVDTGIARRDADLCKPRFLDTDRHPVMAWSAERFTPDGDGTWTAHGVLRVRGTSTPLPMSVVPESAGPDGAWLRVRGSAVLDRRAVGIRAPRFLIGHAVEIAVDAWLTCP